MFKRLAVVAVATIMPVAVLVPTPTQAATFRETKCWGGDSPADGGDCVYMYTEGGRQRDGTGVYVDTVRIDCLGHFEKDPAIDGYDLTVTAYSPLGNARRLYHHTNPNVNSSNGDWCNERTFMTSVRRKKGFNIVVTLTGKARRDFDRDKTFTLMEILTDA